MQPRLTIHFIMAAHIKEDDFCFGEQKSEGDAVVVGETDGVAAGGWKAAPTGPLRITHRNFGNLRQRPCGHKGL